MKKIYTTYCEFCEEEVTYTEKTCNNIAKHNGKSYKAELSICDNCGALLDDSYVDED